MADATGTMKNTQSKTHFHFCSVGPVQMTGGREVSWTQRLDLNWFSIWTQETHINTRCKCNQVKIISRYNLDTRHILWPGVNSLSRLSSTLPALGGSVGDRPTINSPKVYSYEHAI